MEAAMSGRHWTRVRTLGRGASGAVVSLVADKATGELFAVKWAGAAGAAQLRREGGILSGLCSPHVVPCLGFGGGAGGDYQVFLEFAPGGSLADVVARNGGRLDECAIRAYAADVVMGLAYLHGKSLVHGDVKGRNVVVGADGRAKLADFGCARHVDSLQPIGGTPAFMAPEVARGEEQGPAADVWALGCTVIEMATGRAPWSDTDDVVAAVHRIGYTDAVPEAPGWLSAVAKDFLDKCFRKKPRERWTAAKLLEHPFMALASRDVKTEEVKATWVSPKSTLDAALWESESDDEVDEMSESPIARVKSLAGPCSALPDWDYDQDWIEVCSEQYEVCGAAAATPAEEIAGMDEGVWSRGLGAETELVRDVDGDSPLHNVGVGDVSIEQQEKDFCSIFSSDPIVLPVNISDKIEIVKSLLLSTCLCTSFASVNFVPLTVMFGQPVSV